VPLLGTSGGVSPGLREFPEPLTFVSRPFGMCASANFGGR